MDGHTDHLWQQCCKSCVSKAADIPGLCRSGAIGTTGPAPFVPTARSWLVTTSLVALDTLAVTGLPLGLFTLSRQPGILFGNLDPLQAGPLCLRTLFQGICWPWMFAGEVLGVGLGWSLTPRSTSVCIKLLQCWGCPRL